MIQENVSIGPNGQMSSDDDSGIDTTTIELVNDYIRRHVKGASYAKYGGSMVSSSRYGGAADYYLPLDAKDYFDHIGFKQYKVIKMRSAKKGMWRDCVAVEFWKLPEQTTQENMETGDFSKVTFDAEEVSNFVSDYIRKHKIGERQTSGSMWEYELPVDAAEAFRSVGFNLFSVETVVNPTHPEHGKKYVLVKSWPKVY